MQSSLKPVTAPFSPQRAQIDTQGARRLFERRGGTQDVLDVPVRKVVIQVVAGRNIAVLVEAAVRNTILQMRGVDTYKDFVERHRLAMSEST